MVQHRAVTLLCEILKNILENGLGKLYATGLKRTYSLSRVEYVRKIRDKQQGKNIGKYSFVNRSVPNWKHIQERYALSFVNLKFLGRGLGKQL